MKDTSPDIKNQEKGSQEEAGSFEVKGTPRETPKKKRKATVDDLKKQLDDQKQIAQDNYEKFLRAYADLENFKKRVEKEKADSLRYAKEEVIRDLLPFVDNLERAVEHASSDTDNNPQALIEGVELTLRELVKALEQHGLRQIESVGKPFDPNLHEAMMQVENDDYDPQTVVEEFQKGYLIRDRLLRPARVSVSTKGEDREEEEEEEEKQQSEEEV
ncbi:MAG: nucleotide exchange factor GrpE [Proteobacteria bacterium]|nr:nucleotide exchange factor GrpE [Pseudomonadota bacterium]